MPFVGKSKSVVYCARLIQSTSFWRAARGAGTGAGNEWRSALRCAAQGQARAARGGGPPPGQPHQRDAKTRARMPKARTRAPPAGAPGSWL